MNKKVIIAVLAVLVFVLVFSACGSKQAAQSDAPAAEASEPTAQPTPPFSFQNFQPTQGINMGTGNTSSGN